MDPDFATNNFIYLYYTVNKGTCYNRVSRFVLPPTNVIDPASEVVLLDNIRSTAGNHNGGDLNFGKDGYLYVSVGDGGCDYESPFGGGGSNQAARNVNTLLGKMLRITRDGAVPPDNPWLGTGTASCRTADAPAGVRCQETYAWGLRNPFRFAMDPGALDTRFFINDVGQNAVGGDRPRAEGRRLRLELPRGRARERERREQVLAHARRPWWIPIYEYAHATGCGSITGGAFVPTGLLARHLRRRLPLRGLQLRPAVRLCGRWGRAYSAHRLRDRGGQRRPSRVRALPGGAGLYYTNYTGGGAGPRHPLHGQRATARPRP